MAGVEPTFDPKTNVLTIPRNGWATYYINGERVTGSRTITELTKVTAEPIPPSRFREDANVEWVYSPTTGLVSANDVRQDEGFEDETPSDSGTLDSE